tara:strand:- start:831 stop:1376 length:546 start_codon:yes stop_codon:yes gene_type:complete
MNYYETLYIVHPALESGRLKDIILSIEEIFKNSSINIVSTNVWGKKKLAYLIDKQKYGTYVLVQFQSDGQTNSKLSVELEHNPNILSYLTTKITEDNLNKDLPSIDEQIHGSRVSEPQTDNSSESSNESEPTKEQEESKNTSEPSDSDEAENKQEVSEDTEDEEIETSTNETSEENDGTNE